MYALRLSTKDRIPPIKTKSVIRFIRVTLSFYDHIVKKHRARHIAFETPLEYIAVLSVLIRTYTTVEHALKGSLILKWTY